MEVLKKSSEARKKPYISRPHYETKLTELIQSPRIVVLQGQRRVGKSSLMLNVLSQRDITAFYLNKEYDSKGEIPTHHQLSECFDNYVSKSGDPQFIVIDEIQDIIGREKFIREKNAFGRYHIIITGSNSSLLSSELTTYLTGRYMTLDVASLSYNEWLIFHNTEHTIKKFWEYCEYGGLPETCFLQTSEQKKQYCQLVLSDIILKDIVGRYRIHHPRLLSKILSYLGSITGKICSLRSISAVLENEGRDISLNTLSSYMSYLAATYLIAPVSRYAITGKKLLTHKDKYFFGDLGIKHSLGYNALTDISGIMETVVYQHCVMMGYRVLVGEFGDKEIDFVCTKGNDIIYIQVAYSVMDPQIAKREFGNLLAINDNHPKLVISLDSLPPSSIDGVQWLSVIDFLTSWK